MADLPARPPESFYARMVMQIRALLPSAARTPLPPPGISIGRVASARHATEDLQRLATSPTVYAAVNRRALTIARFPIRCYRGLDPQTAEPLDPARVPWADQLLRLLRTPDPADLGALFPAQPGVRVWSQVIADLMLTGWAFVIPTGQGEGVIGLRRAHPSGAVLERDASGEYWAFPDGTGKKRRYPRRSVAHLSMLSAAAGGGAEIGIGAARPLASLLNAEELALQQTADKIAQGGVDLVVTGRDAATLQYLSNKANREAVADQVSEALSGNGKGRRVFVLSGSLDLQDAGFRPADLQSGELLTATERKTLQALGTVPISLGAEASTFATAVQQYRAQADLDAGLCAILEGALFRPLAKQFAASSGGRWATRAEEVTCRFDLSSHPGNVYARGEAIDRAQRLIAMGWSPLQAAEHEGLNLPEPEGTPASAAPIPASPASTDPLPLGDTEPGTPEPDSADPQRQQIVAALRSLRARGLEVAAK